MMHRIPSFPESLKGYHDSDSGKSDRLKWVVVVMSRRSKDDHVLDPSIQS